MTRRSRPNNPSDAIHWPDAGDASSRPRHQDPCVVCPFGAANASTARMLPMSAPLSEPIQGPLAFRSDRDRHQRRHQSP